MHANASVYTIDKKSGRQQVLVCLFLLPLVLFALSGFTFIPNTAQTSRVASGTPLPLTFQMSVLHTASTADDGCSDVAYIDQLNWQEIKIFFNLCALEHLSALTADGSALAGLIAFICPDCTPLAAGITALVAGVEASLANLKAASQQCSGAYLDISWSGGWQFEPACSTQNEGS